MNGQTFSTNPRKEGKSHHLIMFPTNQRAQQKQWLFPLACKDGQGRFNESFFACAFFFLSAFLYMEISSCTPIPLFTTKNQYTVPQPAEITGQAFPAKLHVSLFTCDSERMYIYKPSQGTLLYQHFLSQHAWGLWQNWLIFLGLLALVSICYKAAKTFYSKASFSWDFCSQGQQFSCRYWRYNVTSEQSIITNYQ